MISNLTWTQFDKWIMFLSGEYVDWYAYLCTQRTALYIHQNWAHSPAVQLVQRRSIMPIILTVQFKKHNTCFASCCYSMCTNLKLAVWAKSHADSWISVWILRAVARKNSSSPQWNGLKSFWGGNQIMSFFIAKTSIGSKVVESCRKHKNLLKDDLSGLSYWTTF
jgi:hypothetical protein